MYCIYEIDAVCSPEHCEAIFMRGVPAMYCIYEIDAVCSLTALAQPILHAVRFPPRYKTENQKYDRRNACTSSL